MDITPSQLKEFGIDIGLLISGMFGALLMTSKTSARSVGATITSIVGGAASANYLTPMLATVANITEPRYLYGFAFLLGFLGLKGVEMLSKRIMLEEADIIHPHVEHVQQHSTDHEDNHQSNI